MRRSAIGFLALLLMFWMVQAAAAQELRNFHHTTWSFENKMGAVFDIQQSPKGYLWLTASRGVFRFDGVRFQSADEVTSGATRQHVDLASVFASPSGDIWLRTRLPGLLLWRDGKLSAFSDQGCKPGLLTDSTIQDRDGTLWVAGSSGLFIIGEGRCERVGEKYGLPGGFPSAITLDNAGTLWVKMPSGALLYLRRGDAKFQVNPYGSGPVGDFAYLHAGPDGSVWLSDEAGLRRVSTGGLSEGTVKAEAVRMHKGPRFGNFTFDGNGTLWAASSTGVRRIPDAAKLPLGANVDPGAGESFGIAQGLSSDVVWKIFADREGNIWVGTNSGLDQLRQNVISQVAIPQTREHQFAVAAGDDDSVWIGSRTMPLTRIGADGRTRVFSETGQTISIRRDREGGLWSAGYGKRNLWRISNNQLEPVKYPNEATEVAASTVVDKNRNLWVMTFAQQVYRHNGQDWTNENRNIGREPGVLGAMEGDPSGNVWFAFSNHVVEWDGSSYRRYTYAGKNRYPTCMTVRGDHVWLGAEDGVQLLTQGEFRMLRWKETDLPGRATGIVETESGDLWVSGFSGIAHVKAEELRKWLLDPNYAVSAESFDTLDGLPGLAAERYPEPSIVEASDGRLWFATTQGIAWLDPSSLTKANQQPPPTVLVESLIFDGKAHTDLTNLKLPPHTGNVEIDYTALSLRIPERVRFRYQLDGVDEDWQDAGTRRQAFYTKLRPGLYRFRVIACNSTGVWNETGATLDFSVAPAFYQTTWFLLLCVAAFAGLLWALYQLRVHQMQRQFARGLEVRVGERLRIARELHDTLLQSFQGVAFQLQAARNLLLRKADNASAVLDEAIVATEDAIQEGRSAIRDLRPEPSAQRNLPELLNAVGREQATAHEANDRSPSYRVVVEGKQQDLSPMLQDEVYRIAREVIRNAFAHAAAAQIEVEIRYDQDQLRLRVRDDGKGIDPKVLETGGQAGHFGIPGMRERAQRIGSRLDFWSETGAGTEVQLTVPASMAYQKRRDGHRFRLFHQAGEDE